MKSTEIRDQLIKTLRLDLVGPHQGLGNLDEILDRSPSRFYLTGFLVPVGTIGEERSREEADEEIFDELPQPQGRRDDTDTPDRPSTKKKLFPASMGLSFIVPVETVRLVAAISWGDYLRKEAPVENLSGMEQHVGNKIKYHWHRRNRIENIELILDGSKKAHRYIPIPNSGGLEIFYSIRPAPTTGAFADHVPAGARVISVFLVNKRTAESVRGRADETFAFQCQLEITSTEGFLPRPNLRGSRSDDPDERIADLQYRDACEFAAGHNVSVQATVQNGCCKRVATTWLPEAEVERISPVNIKGVELSMDALSELTNADDAGSKLMPIVTQYRRWIQTQDTKLRGLNQRRSAVAAELLKRAGHAADRIEKGIKCLTDANCLEAFRVANRVMAAQGRQRRGVWLGNDPSQIKPVWRPFQLAFILMNLPGIADPADPDRRCVDLLFFPTGGGKTEAYLGLAAFTLVLRRLRDPGIGSAGLAVLMRYTLRLLTLDQLSRAATLICALELEREKQPEKLGTWPFEIGLWVGQAATPNKLGKKGASDDHCARTIVEKYKNDTTNPRPIPISECPWCGHHFDRHSFSLWPNKDYPTELRVSCTNRDCAFAQAGKRHIPIQAVDECIYRRLPCFMIATVDKFATLPWEGRTGALFGRVERYDTNGFYGPTEQGLGTALPNGRLNPPDLVIQDELHLISGPLGTMVGLYEAAIDELSTVKQSGLIITAKIIASTATVRRAERQIQALFGRTAVEIFPPVSPDRHDSFFAESYSSNHETARIYLGVAAQGRSPKLILLSVYMALMAAAQKAWNHGPSTGADNPADPYMTLLGYFNSLRELGAARRIVEDEVRNGLLRYAGRRRVGESVGEFANRPNIFDPQELTSRVSTDEVAGAKRSLAQSHKAKDHVDVALATNMISVGLDIPRLGLMVVQGQPKSSAEYIQATSRIGRGENKPGLVVTLLNIHRPRDRSHFERFTVFHESFYRAVEATSVTPFSPRALDRGLAGTLVALARLGDSRMTPGSGAGQICAPAMRDGLREQCQSLATRAENHRQGATVAEKMEFRDRVAARVDSLLEDWHIIAREAVEEHRSKLIYQKNEDDTGKPLLRDFLDPELDDLPIRHRNFRANRSLRDVEPVVDIWVQTNNFGDSAS
ncbi:MAG: DISARM system helicase DrmA [Planctomycetia bacterium]|nr:DISARM system helicase DrmA [Planctomycetia bacterium]